MEPSAQQVSNLRVLTLNLWGRDGPWEQRRGVLSDGLRGLRPDIIAFQESIVTDDYDQVADLLGADYHVAHQTARHADGMGVSIASRWPIGEVRELDLHLTPRTGEFPCTTLAAEIAGSDTVGPLLLVNHFPSYQLDFEAERALQAVAAARSSTTWSPAERCTSCSPATSTLIQTLPASASGPGARPSRA